MSDNEFRPVNASAGPVTVQTPWPALPGWRLSVKKVDTTPNTVRALAGFQEFTLSLPYQRVDLEKTEGGWDWKVT